MQKSKTIDGILMPIPGSYIYIDEVKRLIKKSIKQAFDYLDIDKFIDQAHGGGNGKRLLHQLKQKQKEFIN